ncbi:Oidioi.mRNA.OKI2018_I69.XSR.g16648.t1.cds [Oikopleura dioica]|uniref:Oidioi.mRNA.OKI2018_I69.XSR.g16648.t1.cds n=1 Tax=Oikopleura dioica TaxID=34765 RepID=A0ABN7SLZ4_OIKDI|nr:Oidioi.mRNA.OKI2018_I69.XSR.g16648.t1.cds [Oikopleura dioica]
MFRVLAQFIHALGTLLLITGLICQLISIVSSKWISHFLTSDASVVYYEGLWHRCTQQAATPISQWACWNWRGFSNGQKLDENSTPISVLGARVLLISAIICSSLGSAIVWLACKCSVLIQDGAKPCVLLLTGALACISGILSGTGVTWRAIQVLKMSNSFYNQETISNSNDELAISFDSGVWFGWASMVFLVIAGVILALASRLLQPRRSYPLHSTITQPVSRYTEYL